MTGSGSPTEAEFAGLIGRLRAGDEAAAAELVRRFEPEIRRRIRTWLRVQGPGVRRVFESMDICQSVLGHFFFRAAAGQYELGDPNQVLGLLVSMARRKLSEQARDQHRVRRDARRTVPLGDATPADGGASPSRIVAGRDLLGALRARLTEEERRVADLRAAGGGWAEVAATLGGTPEARRKQWSRAVDRVARDLGLDPDDGEPLE